MTPPIARRSAIARWRQLALIALAVVLSVALCVAAFEFAELIGTALGVGGSTSSKALEEVPDGAVVLTARTSSVTTVTALDAELLGKVRAVAGVLSATGTFDQPVAFRLQPGEQPERPVALRGVVFSAASGPSWSIVSGHAPVGRDEVAVDAGGAVVGQVARATSPTWTSRPAAGPCGSWGSPRRPGAHRLPI